MSFSPAGTLLRLASLALMWQGYQYGVNVILRVEWIANSKCGLSQFLTIQSLVVSMLTMVAGLLADVTSSRQVRKLQRVLLAIALPVAWTVTIIYWILLIFLPELILPAPDVGLDTSLDASPDTQVLSRSTRIPLIHEMILHVFPAISLTVEFMFFQPAYPKRVLASSVPLAHVITGAYYGTYVEYCSAEAGEFPYPFLTVAPFHIRIVIYACGTLLGTALLLLLSRFHPGKSNN